MDDDDAAPAHHEIDCLRWNPLQPETVPWDKLEVVKGEKMSPHIIVAGAIAIGSLSSEAFQKMPDAMKFWEAFEESSRALMAADEGSTPERITTLEIGVLSSRDFTEEEVEMYDNVLAIFKPPSDVSSS
jgi:hypothetical protein